MSQATIVPQELSLTVPGGASQPTSYFKASGPRAVLFAPGVVFHHDCWHHLARPLQKTGMASFCLEDSSSKAVQAGVAFLQEKGYGPICLAGGSAGGSAVLKAIQYFEAGVVD